MIYVTSYQITIHYSHCRIFSHGSLMGSLGMLKKHVTMTLRRINMINYIEPPKKIERGFQDAIDEVFPSPGFQLGHLFGDIP